MKDKTLKGLVKIHNAVAEAINDKMEERVAATSEPEDFGEENRIKCIRFVGDYIEYYNCKTGEVIK